MIEKQIKEHAGIIRKGKLHPDSLLAILMEQPKKKKVSDTYQKFPTPEGTKWENILIEIISRDSVKITANGVSQRYTALDMGFRDKRKGDLPNEQWDLLLSFAEQGGVFNWSSTRSRVNLYKSIQHLKRTLCSFFQIDEPPIKTYKKRQGYVAKFRISDLSSHP